jgi:hypothetical protein
LQAKSGASGGVSTVKSLQIVLRAAIPATAAVIGLATPAHADPNDDSLDDQLFARMLADNGVLFNLNLEKFEAKRACDSYRRGEGYKDVVHDLMQSGGYPWDVAYEIFSATEVTYCHDVPMH